MKNQALSIAKGAGIAALGALLAIALVNKVRPLQKLTGRV